MDIKLKRFNRYFPIYKGLSTDLLFYIAIDTLFLTTIKGLSASQIAILGIFPTLLCICFQKLLVKLESIIGNVNSSKLGTLLLLISSIIITFGKNIIIIGIGLFLYDIAFVFKNTESIILKNNLDYQKKSDTFFKYRGRANTIYAVSTLIVSLISGSLFAINPYLPMYCCITICFITLLLSTTVIEVETEEVKKEIKKQKVKINKTLIIGILSYVIFLGLVVLGQQNGKLYIQYKLEDIYSIEKIATYISVMVALSRVSRIIVNLIFNKIYKKIENYVGIILSIVLILSFGLILSGGLLPNIYGLILMIIGFSFIIPLRDPFIIHIEDFLLKNSEKKAQQQLFTNLEILRKLGKVVINIIITLILLKFDLTIVMVFFIASSFLEVFISYKLLKLNKDKTLIENV